MQRDQDHLAPRVKADRQARNSDARRGVAEHLVVAPESGGIAAVTYAIISQFVDPNRQTNRARRKSDASFTKAGGGKHGGSN